jgi:hypothetical protein
MKCCWDGLLSVTMTTYLTTDLSRGACVDWFSVCVARCRVRRTVWFGIIDPREERVGVGSIGPHRFDGVVDLGAARPT